MRRLSLPPRCTLRIALLAAFVSLEAVAASPAPAAPVTVVPTGATWAYRDTPVALDSTWNTPGFDDSTWPTGPAPLGYGEGTIVTTVPFGGNANDKYITTYFRIEFTVADDPADITSLLLGANYDDGFVAYLNGNELARRSLPAGTITYSTTASSHESGALETINAAPGIADLVQGTNLLAVELHQQASNSSDLFLDMQLTYSTDSALVTRGPYLQSATPTQVVVRWRTDSPVVGTLRAGPSPDSVQFVATNGVLDIEHEVTLSGLTPDTRYYYSVGTVATELAGDSSYTFRTAPPVGPAANTRIWVIGDSGLPGVPADRVRDKYAAYPGADDTDVWLMLGDNAYNTGTDSEYQVAVFDQYPEMLRQWFLWPTRGNHDGIHIGTHNDYYEIFTLPTDGVAGGLASGTEAYYSFDHANVHFICLDSEGSSRAVGSPMLQWLRNDLAATTRDWIIAYWHHPPYTKGSHDSDNAGDSGGRMRDMRENVLPILDSTGVDLVLSGHSHTYERSFLLNGHYGTSGTLVPSMEIDDGDGRETGDGAYEKTSLGANPFEGSVYVVAGSSSRTSGGPLNHPVMVKSIFDHGSLVLDISGSRLDAHFLNDEGAVTDSFTIIKGPTVGAPAPPLAGRLELSIAGANPFSGDAQLQFALPAEGYATVGIYDVAGRRLATLFDGVAPAGRHVARWQPDAGVTPGVYFAVLEFGRERRAIRLVRVD